MSRWAIAGLVIAGFICLWIVGKLQWDKKARALLKRRSNPTRDEFVALLATECAEDVAEFLWDELQVYFRPLLTPHPDDDLVDDLPIDPEEPEDWVVEFCKQQELRISDFAEWPKDLAVTPRNLGAWLTHERNRLDQS